MPQRHSKNQGAMGSMITYQERKKIKDGTQKARFGVDSQLPFGYCCLSLCPVKEPVVTPSGHMYSKEAIYEYLLTKNQELKRQQALYEAQEYERMAEEEARSQTEATKATDAFVRSQESLADTSQLQQKKRKRETTAEDLGDGEHVHVVENLSKEIGDKVTKSELQRTSFWVPEFTPQHVQERVKAPPKRPLSPMSGQPLRLKDLMPVNLTIDQDTRDKLDKKYICAVTQKQITFQSAVLLRKPKAVILQSGVYDDLVAPTMTCPLSGDPLKKKDVVKLARAGSSFARIGNVEAKKYTHTTT